MKTVLASSVVEYNPGGQKAKCIAVTDAGRFVIKVDARNHAQAPHNKGFANELLANTLASQVGIGIVDHAIVKLTNSHLVGGVLFSPDVYFGSRFSKWPALADGIRIASNGDQYDLESMHKLFALDVLLMNPDRKGSDVLFSRSRFGNKIAFKAIDFANALTGDNWTADHLARNHQGNAGQVDKWLFWEFGESKAGRRVARHIRDECGDFGQVVKKVGDDCGLSSADMVAAVAFLKARAQKLPELVESHIETAHRGSRE